MRFWSILFALALLVLLADSSKLSPSKVKEKVRYDGYVVYKLKISDKSQLSALSFVEKHTDKFSIWKEYDARSKEVHVMVHPKLQQFFKQLTAMNGIQMAVMIDDVQKLIESEQPSIQSANDDGEYIWTRYHTLEEVYQWLDKILQEHSAVTEEILIGKSYEGRTIRGIKISFKANNPGLFIESNIHAREWITVETATWLINQLLKSTDPAVRELAESVDWYIVPVLNVDGFVYSHEKDRLWRKTRQPHPQSECIGADPNRNYDVEWMVNGGASQDPCSYNFAGLQPFSEPEIKAIADYVASIKNKLNIMLAFHSYSQLLLSPYGHTTNERPPNHDDLMAVGEAYASAVMSLPYKTNYEVGPTAEVLYVASGGMNDWAYTKMDIKLSYTIEFRDQGRFGFVLPPIHIIPNCEETLAGLIEFVKKAKALGYLTIKS